MTKDEFNTLSKAELHQKLLRVLECLDVTGKGYVDEFENFVRREIGYPKSSGGWAGREWFERHNPKESK